MGISGALSLHSYVPTGIGKIGREQIRFEKKGVLFHKISVGHSKSSWGLFVRREKSGVKVYCSFKTSGASSLDQEIVHPPVDEYVNLKSEADKVIPFLNGCCVYLVGMMGSGKTTIGKILSEAIGYSFVDSDKLVEQAVGATSVAQIFNEHGEEYFRDIESKVLKDLSTWHHVVVATGGGAVIWPDNWRCMKNGVSVWLDVPLEVLARRITTIGTASRPLLPQGPEEAYTKAFERLTALYEERCEAYANADARVFLQSEQDLGALSPTAITIEVLVMMKQFLMIDQHEEVHVSMV